MKTTRFIILMFIAVTLSVTTNSCKKDNDKVLYGTITITLKMSEDIIDGSLSDAKIEATNLTTQRTQTLDITPSGAQTWTAELAYGAYRLVAGGKLHHTVLEAPNVELEDVEDDLLDDLQPVPVEKTDNFNGISNVTITKEQEVANIEIFPFSSSSGFVIKELSCFGIEIPVSPFRYDKDAYMIICNNSDETLYADGLCIFENNFLTDSKYIDIYPDKTKSHYVVKTVYMVPGSGNQYPVAPGEEIVIAAEAINHKSIYSDAADLSHADFEIYTGENDTDNPDVTNLIQIYDTNQSYYQFSVRPNRSYAIGKLPAGVNADNFITQLAYEFEAVDLVLLSFGIDWPDDHVAYAVPNANIYDVMTQSIPGDYMWMLCASSLDLNYFPMALGSANFGKAVIRKTSIVTEERTYLQKTNNSSVDFKLGSSSLR